MIGYYILLENLTVKRIAASSGSELTFYKVTKMDCSLVKGICLLFILLTFSLTGFAQNTTWTQKADLNYSRWRSCANYSDGKIYTIGGVGAYQQVEEYDIESDSWQAKTSMPTGRAFIGSGVVDGNIFIIGGTTLDGPVLDIVEMYNPVSDEWKTVEGMTNARFGMGSCVYNDKIFIFGGNNPAVKTTEAYDPTENKWISNLADMPTARWEADCVLVEDQIYVIGGFLDPTNGLASSDVEVYSPETDTWTIKASLPEKRGGGTAAYINGKIYYFGGSSEYDSPKKNVWVYTPENDQWVTAADMPFAWFLMASCVVGEEVYLISGSRVSWPHDDNFKGVYAYTTDVASAIEDYSVESNTQFYPNPANNTLYFRGDQYSHEMSYKIFNPEGIIQSQGTTKLNSINISQLQDGIYFIILNDDNKQIKNTFLKVSH